MQGLRVSCLRVSTPRGSDVAPAPRGHPRIRVAVSCSVGSVRWLATLLVALLVASACGGASDSAELEALREEVESLKVATTVATTTVATTTTSAPTTTTTTTTIPGPRWDFDASFDENMKMLVGAPIDPLFEDDIETFTSALEAVGYSVRERYWANYVSLSEVYCQSLEDLWDQGTDENWSRRKAANKIEQWSELIAERIQTMDGFRSVSDEEALAIAAASLNAGYCWYIFENFDDFING